MISDAGTNTTTANITMSKTLDTLYLVFESNDSSSLLTETKIAKMKAIEESIVGLTDFSEWCQINELGGEKHSVSYDNLLFLTFIHRG
jgi:hypothetical protein